MTFKSVWLILLAAFALDIAGPNLPPSALDQAYGHAAILECTDEDDTSEHDNLSSEPSLIIPLLFLAKVGDERSGIASALDPPSKPLAATPRSADSAVLSQCPPRAPGLHVLCTYLS